MAPENVPRTPRIEAPGSPMCQRLPLPGGTQTKLDSCAKSACADTTPPPSAGAPADPGLHLPRPKQVQQQLGLVLQAPDRVLRVGRHASPAHRAARRPGANSTRHLMGSTRAGRTHGPEVCSGASPEKLARIGPSKLEFGQEPVPPLMRASRITRSKADPAYRLGRCARGRARIRPEPSGLGPPIVA